MPSQHLTAAEQREMETVTREVAIIKARLDAAGIPARTVVIRQDVLASLPDLQVMNGLPVVRTPAGSPARWGLLV